MFFIDGFKYCAITGAALYVHVPDWVMVGRSLKLLVVI